MKEVDCENSNDDDEMLAPRVAALVALVSVLKLKNQSKAPVSKESVVKLHKSQLGLYESDTQHWSPTKLQSWIKEAEQLLADMEFYTDMEIIELRSLVERELNKKKLILND